MRAIENSLGGVHVSTVLALFRFSDAFQTLLRKNVEVNAKNNDFGLPKSSQNPSQTLTNRRGLRKTKTERNRNIWMHEEVLGICHFLLSLSM